MTAGPGYDGHRQAEVLEPVRQVLVEPGRDGVRRTDSMISSIGSLKIVSSIASIGSWRTETEPITGPPAACSSAAAPPRRACSASAALSCRSGCSRCSSARAGLRTTSAELDVARLGAVPDRLEQRGRGFGVVGHDQDAQWFVRPSMTGSFSCVIERRRQSRAAGLGPGLGAVLVGHGQVDDDGQDRAEEQHAGAEGAEAEAAVGAWRGEVVADVGAQRPGQDVGQPEATAPGRRRASRRPGRPGSGPAAAAPTAPGDQPVSSRVQSPAAVPRAKVTRTVSQ